MWRTGDKLNIKAFTQLTRPYVIHRGIKDQSKRRPVGTNALG